MEKLRTVLVVMAVISAFVMMCTALGACGSPRHTWREYFGTRQTEQERASTTSRRPHRVQLTDVGGNAGGGGPMEYPYTHGR